MQCKINKNVPKYKECQKWNSGREKNTLGSLKPIMLRVSISFDESKSSNHLSKYLFKF